MTTNEAKTIASQTLHNLEWTRVSLAQVCNVVRGGSPRPAGDPRYFNGDFIPWLTVAALTNIPASQLTVLETTGKLTEAGAQFSRNLAPGTVIISNSGATLGVAKILGVRCCANDGIAALLDLRADIDARYVVHYINNQTEKLRTVVATGNGQPNLNTGLIGAIEIDLPCKAEQSAIADALGEIDALIDSLEHLLTKKRQIKQGAMQELLTGKRRLPGFSRPWASVRLGDIGRTYGGLTGKSKADFGYGEAKYVTFMNVMTNVRTSPNMVESVYIEPLESQNLVQVGDLLFNGSSETPDEVAFCSWVESCGEDLFLNSFCFGFRTTVPNQVSGLFMAYFFRARPGRIAVSSLAQGATRYNIGKTALLQASLKLPDFEEQEAIAETLSSIDDELTVIEARLTKARALKQAMAQALLTGRIRFPIDPQEPAVPVLSPVGVSAFESDPMRTRELYA